MPRQQAANIRNKSYIAVLLHPWGGHAASMAAVGNTMATVILPMGSTLLTNGLVVQGLVGPRLPAHTLQSSLLCHLAVPGEA